MNLSAYVCAPVLTNGCVDMRSAAGLMLAFVLLLMCCGVYTFWVRAYKPVRKDCGRVVRDMYVTHTAAGPSYTVVLDKGAYAVSVAEFSSVHVDDTVCVVMYWDRSFKGIHTVK